MREQTREMIATFRAIRELLRLDVAGEGDFAWFELRERREQHAQSLRGLRFFYRQMQGQDQVLESIQRRFGVRDVKP